MVHSEPTATVFADVRTTIASVGMLATRRWLVSRFVLLTFFALPTGLTAAEPTVDYQREIKPLFRNRCVACHGPIKQEAGLRLDAAKLVLTGGDSGPAVVVGQSAASLLIERITSTDADTRMPPKGAALAESEIALLSRWINQGARGPADEPVPPRPADHWSFQPVRSVAIPSVTHTEWPRNPIDHFVLRGLEQQGWTPNPPASPEALLRRVTLDLTGLPPTIAEQEAFAAGTMPGAYEAWVDELLRRPSYGERFARHWLDVVRYADSNGYERDAAKPQVWKYRDYVIQALNADTPFPRFIQEQIAGDELDDAGPTGMVAVGFHRLGPWDDEPADVAADAYDQLDDLVNTTSQAFLGLTMGCARCHDHKFDPLTQRDYYSLLAVFHPLTRPRQDRTELTLPLATWQTQQGMTADEKSAAPQAYYLREDRTLPITNILLRGSPHARGPEVGPAIPAVLERVPLESISPGEFTSQRRLALARWISHPDHPLTARVMVNRVWQWHFGEGLVRTPNDFGLNGERPTHPELLDYLASWFTHEAHGSLKQLHRLIVTSATYQQSRADQPDCRAIDPENRWLWRRSWQRLEVEAIRDSMLAVSGQLNLTMYGPPMFPLVPKEAMESHADKSIWPPYDETAASRRTVYAFMKRSLIVPMLEVFDLCDTTRSSPKRNVTTVPTQALTLFNSEFVMQQAGHLAQRLRNEAGADGEARLTYAWRLALARRPEPEELRAAEKFLDQQQQQLRAIDPQLTAAQLEAQAWTQLCRVLLNMNEFVYPE